MTMNFFKWPSHLVWLAAPTLSKMIDQAAAFETSKDYPAALTVCNQILALDPSIGWPTNYGVLSDSGSMTPKTAGMI